MHAERLDYLDGWRGLAIAFLLIGHFFPVPGINFGAVGVSLFFVLSGLFMARLLFVQAVPLDRFYTRRITRIFPAAFAFLLAVIAYSLVFSLEINWRETLAAGLFVNNYFPAQPGKGVMPFGHIWSLSVEEHSYILLSLLALAVRRTGLDAVKATGTAAAFCAAMGVWYWLQYRGPQLDHVMWLRTEVSAYGIFLSAGIALLVHGRRAPGLSWWVCPALLASGIALHWWSIPQPVRLILGVGAFAIAVNLLESSSLRIKSLLSFRPLRQLGLWSFSIYLWQQPFYLLVYREGMSRPVALALALICGLASFYLVEKPARRYLNRQWDSAFARSRPSPDEASSSVLTQTRAVRD